MKKKNKMQSSTKAPTFNALKRAFMKKVHPDLFHQLPEIREANEAASQRMNEFLDACRSDELPRCERVEIPFHYRNGGKIETITLVLSPTGGKCAKLIMKQFSGFFGRLAIPNSERFTWDPEYWPCEVRVRETDDAPAEEEA